MDDILFYKSDVIPILNDRTLSLTTKTRKSIQINIDALLQILCDKYEHPTIKESYAKTIPIDLQLRIQNLYADIQDKLEHATLKYNKILALQDKRIEALVQDYYQMHIIPLNLKIEYMEWEKGLVSGYISREIEKKMDENTKLLSKVQIDYADKLQKAEVKNNTILEKYKNKVNSLESTIESIENMRKSEKEKQTTLENDKNEMYERFKNAQSETERLKADEFKLKSEIEKLKKEVEKHKVAEEWVRDPISTDDEPIYYNQVSGELVKYPENFAKNYKPETVQDDNIIYKEKNGDKEFKLPKSLLKFVAKAKVIETKIDNGTQKDTKDGIKGRIKVVLDALSSTDWQTADEIAETAGVATNHVYEELKKLIEMVLTVENDDEDEGIKTFKKK